MKFTERRQQLKKHATIQTSKQKVEEAIRAGNEVAEIWMNENFEDSRLNQLQNSIDFLSSILSKTPQEMTEDGVRSIEEYFDDAIKPDYANKVKSEVDMILKWKREANPATVTQTAPMQQPTMASKKANGAAFVSNRDEKGEPKAPEKMEVPRLAAQDKKAAPKKEAEAAPVVEPTPTPDPAAAPTLPETGGTDLIDYIPTETLIKVIEDMAKEEDFAQNKNKQDALIRLTEVLKARPIMPAEPQGEGAAPAAPAPSTAPALANSAPAPAAAPVASKNAGEDPAKAQVPLGGLTIAAAEEETAVRHDDVPVAPTPNVFQGGDDTKAEDTKTASWFTTSEEGELNVEENGGRTPEIAEAHGKTEDRTGISVPKTDKPSKFAADMSLSKAVKQSEKLGEDLKRTYLEAKSLTSVNDSRPVREAVESIFRAAGMFDEATKTLNKQLMQEEAEQEAAKIKEENKGKKSSLFGGLTIADEE